MQHELIWQVPAYLPYVHEALTPERVKLFERQHGVKLPVSLVAILSTQNGGYTRFRLPESPQDCIRGIGDSWPQIEPLDEDFHLDGARLLSFDGDGHWHMCLDYRASLLSPSVTYVDIECGHESPVATSFDDFIRMLQPEDDGRSFAVLDISAEQIAALLHEQLGIEFAVSSFDHGYPQHRGCLPNVSDPEWVWISPNRVERGFVRETDRNYSKLVGMLPGTASRFPTLPESAVIVTATDIARARVHLALTEKAATLCSITW